MHDKGTANGGVSSENPCSNMANPNVLSLAPEVYREQIPALRLFLLKYQTYPCKFDCERVSQDTLFHTTTVWNYVRDELKHDITTDCIERTYHRLTKQKYISSQVCDLGNGIMISLADAALRSDIQNPDKLPADYEGKYFSVADEITFYYLREHDDFIQDLSSRFARMVVFESKSSTLQMVCKNDCGFYLSGIKIKKPLITDMALHYGRHFVPTHEKILQSLNEKESKGIVLLHGVPGSGKTHYIRYLIQEVQDKKLIYIPPDMAKEVASPSFLPFLMEHEDAILIIEDAENIIKDRNDSAAPSQAVANLLNLSDGLLGDAMHQQIIATFNCDLTTIDPALLRKGRLIANYEFNKLDVESSKTLSEKLGYGRDGISEPMTLAEIYNQGDKQPNA